MPDLKSPYFLRREDNTPEAWEANSNSHLTEAQVKRLKYVPSPEWWSKAARFYAEQKHKSMEPLEGSYWRSTLWGIVLLLIAVALGAMVIPALAMIPGIAAIGFIVYGSTKRLEAQSIQLKQATEAELLEIALRLSGGEPFSSHLDAGVSDPKIARIQGKLTNGVLGLRIGDTKLTNRIEDNYLDELMRPLVSEDKSKRQHIVKRQREYEAMCYMLVTPPLILSLRPLDAVLPPGEVKLAHVVGVGDDGELVYDDEVSEAQETTEIIEIERKDRTNLS